MAQTQMMMQLMMQQRQDDEARHREERRRDREDRQRLEEATLAAAVAATNAAETMSMVSASEGVPHISLATDSDDKVEVVKNTATLPKLEAVTMAEPAVRCGDW